MISAIPIESISPASVLIVLMSYVSRPVHEDYHVRVLLDRTRIVAHETVHEPGGGGRDGEIEDILFPAGFDRCYRIPEKVTGGDLIR